MYLLQDLVGFTDPRHNIDHYNLLFDVPFPGLRKQNPDPGSEAAGNVGNGTEDLGVAPDNQQSTPPIEERQAQHLEQPIFGIVKHYPPAWWNENKD